MMLLITFFTRSQATFPYSLTRAVIFLPAILEVGGLVVSGVTQGIWLFQNFGFVKFWQKFISKYD